MLKAKLTFVRPVKEVIFGTAKVGNEGNRRKTSRYTLNLKARKSQSITEGSVEPVVKVEGKMRITELPKRDARNRTPLCIYDV